MNTNNNFRYAINSTRLFVTLVLCFCATCGISAQKLAKEVFIAMPDSLNLLLTSVNRADCIDFLESNMPAKVENRLGGTSEMTALTDDYIRMDMSSSSNWEMKLLPAGDTLQVICTITTVCAPVCDSEIRFYTTDWKKLAIADYFPQKPVMNDFLNVPAKEEALYEFNKAIVPADLFIYEAKLSPEDEELTLTLTTPEYMEKEAAEKLTPFLDRPLKYHWSNNRFLPLNARVNE